MFVAVWKRVQVSRIMENSKNLSVLPKLPDRHGHFGVYGGRYVAEKLVPALSELETAYAKERRDASLRKELQYYLREYVGRETPLYFAQRLDPKFRRPQNYLNRADPR